MTASVPPASGAPLRMVAVIGAGRADAALASHAEVVGGIIASLRLGLVTGGLGGVMAAASAGYAAARVPGQGAILGLLPGSEAAAANPHVEIVVPTGLGRARNVLVVLAAEAIVAVGGESGTLSEMALAWQEGRPICAYTPAGGWGTRLAGEALDRRRTDAIAPVADPGALTAWLRKVLAI